MTKRDPERVALARAAAGDQSEALGALGHRIAGQEGPHRELRISDEDETRGRKCGRPLLPRATQTAIGILTEPHQLAVDFCESDVRGIVTSLALAGLVAVHSSRHEISPAIRASDEGPDLIAWSDAVEVVIRRDAEDAKQLRWSCVLHARQSGGFRSLPPCVDGVDGRGRRGSGSGSGGGGGRDGGGLIGTCARRVPLAGRGDQRDQ